MKSRVFKAVCMLGLGAMMLSTSACSTIEEAVDLVANPVQEEIIVEEESLQKEMELITLDLEPGYMYDPHGNVVRDYSGYHV